MSEVKIDDLRPPKEGLERFLPPVVWLRRYRVWDLPRDALAGILVAVLLVPQAMAYAMLADLPAEVGLYAAMVPAVVYAFLGSSRFLSVGPVALVSLLVAEATARVGESDAERAAAALALAAMVGLTLIVLGIFRLGFLANFLSTPVLTGFTAGAAVLIGTSQLKHLFGIEVERGRGFFGTVAAVARGLPETNLAALALGLVCLALLLAGGGPLKRWIGRTSLPPLARSALVNGVPLLVTAAALAAVRIFDLDGRYGVATVGELGAGLPPLGVPPLEPSLWRRLVPSALTVTIVAFVTAVAIAKSLASRRGQRIDPSQEMIALGAANLGGAFTGGYPVGGSISRSALAFSAGGVSPLTQGASAGTVLVAVLTLGPWLASLPRAALAAIILNAVAGMIDVRAIRRVWRFSPAEGASQAATFFVVLGFGVDSGIAVGAASALILYLWRTSRPRIVIEGYLEDSEQFRSEERDDVEPVTSPVLVLRIDENLYFANIRYCEDRVIEKLADQDRVDRLVLDFSTVTEIDSSALEMLERLVQDLGEAGIEVVISEARKPVLDRLASVGFLDELGRGRVFETTLEAVQSGRE